MAKHEKKQSSVVVVAIIAIVAIFTLTTVGMKQRLIENTAGQAYLPMPGMRMMEQVRQPAPAVPVQMPAMQQMHSTDSIGCSQGSREIRCAPSMDAYCRCMPDGKPTCTCR